MTTDKCFACGINPKAPNKNLCAACLEKADTTPRIDGPDFADIDDHPFATVTQADIDFHAGVEIFDDDDSDWDIDNDDENENDSDPLDVCPFCARPMMPGNVSGMCNSCVRDRQGYRD